MDLSSIGNYIDLHLHSNYSDGIYTPTEIVHLAWVKNIDPISLTDHDTIFGLDEFRRAAERYGIETIPGVEISARYNQHTFHIIGYLSKITPSLNELLKKIRLQRIKRLKIMLRLLKEEGINISYNKLNSYIKDKCPNRQKLAEYIHKNGYTASFDEAFGYISVGKPAYVARRHPELDYVIKVLNDCGVSVLAHPAKEAQDYVQDVIDMGLKGIEVYHPAHNDYMIRYYHKVAKQNDLIVTGGSDFHGDTISVVGCNRVSRELMSRLNLKLNRQEQESTPHG